MQISGVSGAASVDLVQSIAGNADIMGKDSFLQLLVAQLKNQDPLEPLDNTEFVAQLAQFSSLEQMQNMNDAMDQNNDLTLSVHNALMTQLIGKEVEIDSNQIYLDSGECADIEYDVQGSGRVYFEVYSADGSLVATVDGEELSTGTHTFSWDGLDENGAVAPDGMYSVKAGLKLEDGSTSDLNVRVKGRISSVRFAGGSPVLYIGNMAINPSEIIGVYDEVDSSSDV